MSAANGILPFALAAGGGSIDGIPSAALAAAGVALLRGHAPLVRALAGRRSAILLPPSPAFVAALAASDGRGAVLVNPLAAPIEVALQCADADVGAVFTIAPLARLVPPHLPTVLLDALPEAVTVTDAEGSPTTVAVSMHEPLRLDVDPEADGRDEEAAIVYTSGMAGRPLGSIATHRNLLANARAVGEAAGLVRDDVVLACLPYAHLFGLTVTLAAPLLAGAAVRTMPRFNPLVALERMETEPISVVVGVPAVFRALLSALAKRGAPLHARHLRICVCGGAIVPPELQAAWYEATGHELREGYGLTEASPVCIFTPIDRPHRRGVLGRPCPGTEVSIRAPFSHAPDADALGFALTAERPEGEIGEICVRGPHVSPGYVSGGAQGLPRPGGWLYTGDLGRRLPDGTIEFHGLQKAMFTRSGFNIYPRELEAALLEHPRIDAARVTAVPSPAREHDIVLHVAGDITEAEVKAWCEARLAQYKQPADVRIGPIAG